MHIGPTITEEQDATRAYHREGELLDQIAALEQKIAATNPKQPPVRSEVDDAEILIYGERPDYEAAIAICLLSIARSQERIADAAETLASVVDRTGTPNVRTDWFSSAV